MILMESQPGAEKNNSTKITEKKTPVTNLAVYKIKKSLRQEGFDLITDKNGKLVLVIRMNGI